MNAAWCLNLQSGQFHSQSYAIFFPLIDRGTALSLANFLNFKALADSMD